jgi:hypothetical protein
MFSRKKDASHKSPTKVFKVTPKVFKKFTFDPLRLFSLDQFRKSTKNLNSGTVCLLPITAEKKRPSFTVYLLEGL